MGMNETLKMKRIVELEQANSKLYEENLKLAKDKHHLWECVVTLKKNVDDLAQMLAETEDGCDTHALRKQINEVNGKYEMACNTNKNLASLIVELIADNQRLRDELEESQDELETITEHWYEYGKLTDYIDACSKRIFSDLLGYNVPVNRIKDAMNMAHLINQHIFMFQHYDEVFHKDLKNYDDTKEGEDDE